MKEKKFKYIARDILICKKDIDNKLVRYNKDCVVKVKKQVDRKGINDSYIVTFRGLDLFISKDVLENLQYFKRKRQK